MVRFSVSDQWAVDSGQWVRAWGVRRVGKYRQRMGERMSECAPVPYSLSYVDGRRSPLD